MKNTTSKREGSFLRFIHRLADLRVSVIGTMVVSGIAYAGDHWALVPPRDGPPVVFDVNGDGAPERIERELGNDPASPRLGVVRVRDGVTDGVLYEVVGETPNDHFAAWATPVEDLNGDGVADLAICAPLVNRGGSREGRVVVVSGIDGLPLVEMSGAADHRFGVYATSAGDRDWDGRGDLWVASLSQITVDTGLLWWTLLSGVDGSALSQRSSVEVLLADVIPVRGGDVNGDGTVDERDLTLVLERLAGDGASARFADVNGDGVVDVQDLGDVIRRFGEQSEPDHPAFGSMRGDLLTCGEVLGCMLDCELCDADQWQDFAIRRPGPVPPAPPPPAPWCYAHLNYPQYALLLSGQLVSFESMHADASIQWEIVSGSDLVQNASVTNGGRSFLLTTGAAPGVIEGRATYRRQNQYGVCEWPYNWSIEVDECHGFLVMQNETPAIPLGAVATFFASGLPAAGSYEWWIESVGYAPGPVGVSIVEFEDPGDWPEFRLTGGRYPGVVSVYVRYTTGSCQRVRVIDIPVVALPENDFDDDGLSDYDEVVFGTNALDDDTDGDRLRDGGEMACGFDPLDPLDPSPDHIGLRTDTDNDGLPDLVESCGLNTDPDYFDSDGDGLGDGWEYDNGLKPTDPDSDGDGVLDGNEDADGDGLSNLDEQRFGSDPNNPDSDGDGTNDFDEVFQGGFPNDPTDGGLPPPEDAVIRLQLTVGDQSTSDSERWELVVGSTSLISGPGEVVSETFPFWRGQVVEIRVNHLGTNQSEPDYDYTASIAIVDGGVIAIDDPDELLGEHLSEDDNPAQNKVAHLYIPLIDLDVDTDNTNGYEWPDRSEEEDLIEGAPHGMKVLIVNRGDRDDDRIPDYADGFGAFGEDSEPGVEGVRFVPLVVDLRGVPPDSTVRFEYPASPPDEVTRETVEVPEILDEFHRYFRGEGSLRLWTLDGDAARTIDDFVRPEQDYPIEEFGVQRVLFVEAVNGSNAPVAITISVSSPLMDAVADAVQVLPFDSLTKLSVNHIAGYTIHYGSAIGGPGNDIIIGSDENDVIEAGAGDDIIVAGLGDDIIDPGEGANVIFASLGQNLIGPLDPPVAQGAGPRPPPNGLRGEEEDPNSYLEETGGPITTDQVLQAYWLLYGQDDPWMRIFLETVEGRIECVESVGPIAGWFRNHQWDRRHDHEIDDIVYVLQVDFELESPFLAATRVREMILHMASSWRGPTHLFQGGMIGIALEQALAGDDYDETIQTYLELRAQAFRNAVAATAALTNIYVNSIGIVSEGADLVVTVSDLTEGKLTAAAGLFPILPARILDDAAAGVLRIVRPGGDVLDEFVKRGRVVWGADSGMGYIVRTDMTFEAKMVNNRMVLLLGRAQNTGGPNGDAHENLVGFLARQRLDVGDAEYATMNRSLRTATAFDNLGDAGRRRPDIIVVRRDGRVDLIEVRSESQEPEDVEDLLRLVRNALPSEHRGSLYGYNLDGTQFLYVGDFTP